jgi:hypothetical protein
MKWLGDSPNIGRHGCAKPCNIRAGVAGTRDWKARIRKGEAKELHPKQMHILHTEQETRKYR